MVHVAGSTPASPSDDATAVVPGGIPGRASVSLCESPSRRPFSSVMTMLSPPEFDAVYLVDTEYQTGTGDRCKPICMVSRELYSGHVNRRWLWNCDPGTPPWNPRDPRTLVVSFSVPAECGVFAALGWEQPCRVHDLWAEHRLRTNGLTRATAFLNVLKSYGIPAPIQTDEKKAWQKLCAEGSSSAIESRRNGIIGYCEGDVGPMEALYLAMLSGTNWREALFRGEYGVACAEIEDRGIPVDADRIAILVDRWVDVRRAAAVIASTRMRFGIYGGPLGGRERPEARVPERRVRGMTRGPSGGFLPDPGTWT